MTRKLLRGARDAKERPRDHGTDRLRLVKLKNGQEVVEQGEKEQGHMVRAERAYHARCNKCMTSIGLNRPFIRVGLAEEQKLYHADCTKEF